MPDQPNEAPKPESNQPPIPEPTSYLAIAAPEAGAQPGAAGPQEKLYCPQCGFAMAAADRYCANCGWDAENPDKEPPKRQPPISPRPLGPVSDFNRTTVLLLCILVGPLGVHRFYVGKVGTGLLWLLTIGFLGIGWIYDLVLIATGEFRDEQGRRVLYWN